ncbi:DUF3892 domain-containing protein [Bacillus sp. HMF5848]|uniref:DUF3892 domain-containing protein n=1 Tax=Bacillus sp. HMF5848 TaxID=2495421 RepID=UPI000F797013|nr:DUF3892 domain-containing protein [Bacillus sp. HMF5848]RSK27244.1 DUF3892 domain-containing protein [Bacillus sp. HMF5848]
MDQSFEEMYNLYKQQATPEQEQQQPSLNQEKIVAVRKNDEGDIIAFKTESGRELDYFSALESAKMGQLAHVDVFQKYGREIIRSKPDGIKENNLDELPTF